MSQEKRTACSTCGALIWEDSLFCTWCGTALPPQETPPSAEGDHLTRDEDENER